MKSRYFFQCHAGSRAVTLESRWSWLRWVKVAIHFRLHHRNPHERGHRGASWNSPPGSGSSGIPKWVR